MAGPNPAALPLGDGPTLRPTAVPQIVTHNGGAFVNQLRRLSSGFAAPLHLQQRLRLRQSLIEARRSSPLDGAAPSDQEPRQAVWATGLET